MTTHKKARPLTIKDLGHRYGRAVTLSGVSVSVSAGSYVTIVGPSGSGKSTLLRAIAGLIKPTSGSILLGDQLLFHAEHKVACAPERRSCAMVFQSYALWPHKTVLENTRAPLELASARLFRPRHERLQHQQRALNALEQVGLASLAERKPNELSGGQQQRVALARALCTDAELMLLDEPLANLDPELRSDMCELLFKLHGSTGRTFVHVTHQREEALSLGTEVWVMSEGRVVEHGPPEQLAQRPQQLATARSLNDALVLCGTVLAKSVDTAPNWKVLMPAGQLECTLPVGAGPVAQGHRVNVWIPLHRLTLGPKTRLQPLDQGELSAAVDHVAFVGTAWLVSCAVEDTQGKKRCRVAVPLDGCRPEIGAEVVLRVSQAMAFPV